MNDISSHVPWGQRAATPKPQDLLPDNEVNKILSMIPDPFYRDALVRHMSESERSAYCQGVAEASKSAPEVGYVVMLRLKAQTRIKQGQWALCLLPSQDEMNRFRPALLAPEYTPDTFKKGVFDLPNDMMWFSDPDDAKKHAEQWASENYVYMTTGDYEVIKVHRKPVVAYNGFEVAP